MSDGYLNYDSISVPLAEATVEQLKRQRERATSSAWVDRRRRVSALDEELKRRRAGGKDQ